LSPEEWAAVRRLLADRVRAERSHRHAPELENEVIEGRYELISELGHGAQGKTHLARDIEHDRLVAIKLLDVAGVDEWKHFELLQREARVLAELQHKRIPELYDSFETDVDGKPGIAVVQEYISGDNLEFRLAAGELFSEEKLMRIAEDVLVILSYLHRLDPPVIHRDVKPANIIVNENREVALVDFGAVQLEGKAQDTVVGTSGYMPPEQLMSRPRRASDIYSLGATLVHLATRKHPGELESRRMKLEWREHANVSEGLMDLIDRMLEPALEDRFESTVDALRALESVRTYGRMQAVPTTSSELVVPRAAMPVGGELVYEGQFMQIRESDDSIAISLERNDLVLALGLAAVPATVTLVIGLMATSASNFAVFVFAMLMSLPGLLLFFYRRTHSPKARLIEFVASDQLTIREDGIIIGRRQWSSSPSLESTEGRYGVVRLYGGYLNRPICRILFGEERHMVGPVNRFLTRQRKRFFEGQQTVLEHSTSAEVSREEQAAAQRR